MTPRPEDTAPANGAAQQWETRAHIARAGWSRHSWPAVTPGAEVHPSPADADSSDPLRPRLIMYRGLPGSGKTSHATEELHRHRAAGRGAARLSRDDVRQALGLIAGATSAGEEAEVTEIQARFLHSLLDAGISVVLLDDTNLTDDRVQHLAHLAGRHDATLDIVDLRGVPVQVCVDRDATRTGSAHVGADRIRSMAAQAGLAGPDSAPVPRPTLVGDGDTERVGERSR
jgi:predicted kinase